MSTKNQCCSFFDAPSISAVLSHSGRAVGRTLARYFESGRHSCLLNVTINPNSYSDWKCFMEDHFAANFLKKYPFLSITVDRQRKALDGFWSSEERCTTINGRFCRPAYIDDWVYSRLVWAREYIHSVLGEFSWDSALEFCDFGPGASVGVPRTHSHRVKKIGHLKPTVTGHCLPLLNAYLEFDPHMRECIGDITVVEGSKVTTVPKDARKDRLIAIEPLWNMFFQKGIGGLIRKHLRRVGIDLNDQRINQMLALEGSLHGRLSTIDLSSASDSISRGLVEFLLPTSWHNAMLFCRSERTFIDGSWHTLRKFSSMGNGFTFELESLIFLALSLSVNPRNRVRRDVSVYGDDIIVPCLDTGSLVRLLSYVGFDTNVEKSFSSGPFRESCGKHYFLGRDVTPFFLRKKIDTLRDLLWLCNSIKRYAFRLMGSSYGLDASLRAVYDHLVGKLPERVRRLSIPDGYGDGSLIRDLDEATPGTVVHTPHGVEGFLTYSLIELPKVKKFNGLPCLVLKLWKTRQNIRETSGCPGFELQEPILVRVRTRKLFVRRWSTLGPWV